MTQGRSGSILLAMVVAAIGASARGQELSRAEVGRALREAEALRACLRVDYEPMFRAGQRPAEAQRTYVWRLADGRGRYYQETTRPPSAGETQRVVQIDTWDGENAYQKFVFADAPPTHRQNVVISDQYPPLDETDELGPSLGIRCWRTQSTVGELLADPDINAEVRHATLDGTPVVEVEIVGPEFVPSAILVFKYDPARQWLLLERDTFGHTIIEGQPLEQGPQLFRSRITASEFTQVDGVWMPGRFDNHSTFRPGQSDSEDFNMVTLITSIQLNPEWSDSDFTVDLASLPPHSQIADARWGGTYRLGEDVVLMGGRLYQLPHVIEEPIAPSRYVEATLGATPIVEPALADSKTPGSKTLSDWMRLTGYVMVAAGAVGAAVLFFRHRFGGR